MVSDGEPEPVANARARRVSRPLVVETLAATVGVRAARSRATRSTKPKDLGQGVNAALEDVKTLGDVLDDQNAVAAYQAAPGAGRQSA